MNKNRAIAQHEIFCANLDDAEKAFRECPKAAYQHLRQLWRENMEENGGKPGPMGPKLEAWETAAEDFRSGAL